MQYFELYLESFRRVVMKYFYIMFLALAPILSQASILSDKQECQFSNHAHSAFDATDRSYSNICGDAVVKAALPSCNAVASDSKRSKVQKNTPSQGVQ